MIIKKALYSFLILGTLLGSSAMFNIMYAEPLTDYTYQGIYNYTFILYGLGDSIFLAITNFLGTVLMGLIDVITYFVDVFVELFTWLSTGLGSIISFFTGGNL
jgi:hypothetical protein